MSLNEELAEAWHKSVIQKLKRRKNYVKFKDNIWAADLTEMGSLSFSNRGFKYLLSVIDVFTKNSWVKPLKDKKAKTVFNSDIEIVNESKRQPHKFWPVQGREFYNSPMQKWLDDNDTFMYSTHNESKSVVAERFIKTIKGKIYEKNEWQLMIENLILVIWTN